MTKPSCIEPAIEYFKASGVTLQHAYLRPPCRSNAPVEITCHCGRVRSERRACQRLPSVYERREGAGWQRPGADAGPRREIGHDRGVVRVGGRRQRDARLYAALRRLPLLGACLRRGGPGSARRRRIG